jgi:hypothetical protein
LRKLDNMVLYWAESSRVPPSLESSPFYLIPIHINQFHTDFQRRRAEMKREPGMR